MFSRYCPDSEITIECVNNLYSLKFTIDNRTIAQDEVTTIWWRQKPFQLYFPDHPERNAAQEFASREWRSMLSSLPLFLTNTQWINPVQEQAEASFKPTQFIWAIQAGFKVPATAFTNSPLSARGLAKRCKRMVYKTFSGYTFPDAKAVFTTEIDVASLADENAVRITPGIYQELIQKEHELRVTFVGDQIFSAKIDSQSRSDTALDWRRNQDVNIYSPVDLDDDILSKIRKFIILSRLKFGVLDLILDQSGQVVFLECNPAGQWLWIEEFTGLPISSAVADALASRETLAAE